MKDVQDLYIKKAKHGEGNGKPLQYSCLGNPKDRGAWWDRVTQRVRLTTQHRKTETGGRRGPRAPPDHRRHPCPGSVLTSCSLRGLRGPLTGVCCWAQKHTWHHSSEGSTGGDPGSSPPPMPSQDQVLGSNCCSEPFKQENNNNKKKAKPSWKNFKKIQISGELYYAHGLECC